MSLRRFFGRGQWDRERSEEIESYLRIETDENVGRGLPHNEARAAALRKFGNRTLIREEIYHINTIGTIEFVARSARQVARMLRRNPWFATASLLTLAIGIGANTAVFSVVNTVLLKPLPYPHAERLISVQHTAPGAAGLVSISGDLRLSPSTFFTYADHNRSFEAIGAWTAAAGTVTGQGEPEEARTIVVTNGVLEALGVKPTIGRWLSGADQSPGAPRTVMLSYGYWQRRFGGDRSAVGRTLTVNALPAQIVGVMPAGFRVVDTEAELIAPFQFNRAQLILPGFFLRSIARLKPGVTLEAAGADIARMVPVWMSSWPAPAGVNPRNWERWRIQPRCGPCGKTWWGACRKTSGSDGHDRNCPADCVRQRSQPATGAGRSSAEGTGCARRAGRGPGPDCRRIASRNPDALAIRWAAGDGFSRGAAEGRGGDWSGEFAQAE
jgi:putative ABC transport system permease protein